jgi:uncharacterized RDD family membrane protein YckC
MRREYEPETSKQGHYAGPATRVAAYVVDLALSVGLFALSVAALLFLLELVTSYDVETDQVPPWNSAMIFAGWLFVYFGGSWAASGKTAGMALLGLRVVDRDGSDLEPWRGFLRAPALALSIAPAGLGCIGVVFGRENRGLQDVIAGSVVVYDWDARSARLRFLARRRTPVVQ